MAKYINMFFFIVLACFILFLILSSFFIGDGDPPEAAVYTFGSMIVILFSFLITQMYYLIDFVKEQKRIVF
jgi:hypothetical protein